ncbi:MAG: hypothetical protein HYY07_03205 [Elusimicrobia bacterium]|nr:hypothetical protein [Elusimicrobiota bacterium]
MIPVLSCGLTALFLRATLVMASFEYKPAGARSQSLSGTCSAPSGDATAPFWNPAALSFLSQGEWVSFYTQLFSLKELRYGGTAIAVPTKMGAFGSSYSQFGFSQYMERQMILSHSLSLSEGVWMGYSLKGLFLQIEGFGSSSAFGLDIGLNTTLSEKLRLGLFARNLNRPTIGDGGETIARSFSIGFSYQLVYGLHWMLDYERTDFKPPLWKSGLELDLNRSFFFRSGFNSPPLSISGGFGSRIGRTSFDYAYQHHLTLPGSHHFSLGFKFGN